MERITNRRVILIILIALLLVCLLGILAYNVFLRGAGDDVAGGIPPTATPVPTEETLEDDVTPEEVLTPTPTRVITGQETTEATVEATDEGVVEPAETPTPRPTTPPATSVAITPSVIEVPDLSQIDEILENGGFEEGFQENGVGTSWGSFQTGSVNVAFSQETAELFVFEGNFAQRISVEHAVEADRFAGIYQTVEVVPGEVYTLTLHGQIRSGFGDVNQSGYGYRMQYVIDYEGDTNWQNIPADEWVELPWDEQLLGGSEFEFGAYTTHITPTNEVMTLFVRSWNKWPIQSLAEYTLDGLSLVGPLPGQTLMVSTGTGGETGLASGGPAAGGATGTPTAGGDQLVDGGLPTTGITAPAAFMHDGRFWGGVIVLLLLALGAIYRAKWRW